MERIEHEEKLIAIHLTTFAEGSNPITDISEPLQVMTLKHATGEKVMPHRHVPYERKTAHLSECLVVRTGSARVDLYGTGKKVFRSVVIKAGEVLIIFGGGHALEYLEPSEIVEMKNGPYVDDKEFI